MIWLAVLLGICVVITIAWSFSEGDSPIQLLTFFLTVMFCGVIFGITKKNTNLDEPTAIDVYRGKTTLQITYKDSIAIDTIVVFKEDIK